jgi:hypothetical protein
MVSLADAPVNLFEKELPGFDEIKRLWRYVNSSESNRIEFRQSAEGQKDALVKGIALLLCGVPTEAAGLLEKGKDCVQKQMALGYAFRQLGKFEASHWRNVRPTVWPVTLTPAKKSWQAAATLKMSVLNITIKRDAFRTVLGIMKRP